MKHRFERLIISLSGKIKQTRWNKTVLNYWHRRTRTLSQRLGGAKLSDDQILQLHNYWSRYSLVDSSEYEFYLNACGCFDVRYIPSGLHYTVIDKHFNDWDRAGIIDNKTEYQRLFPNVKQPESVVLRRNGYWYKDSVIIDEAMAINEILSQLPVFLKAASNSEGGHGVFYMDVSNTIADVQNRVNAIRQDIVVQKPICQSSSLAKLNPSSVNTIRCMTFLDKSGKVKMYSACLRMGICGAKVDNASSGGVVSGIDEKGRLKKYAYKPTGEKYSCHPTSGVVFLDYIIPNFDKVKNLVMSLAIQHPYFRLISWDIALDEQNEPVLIEANLCSGELDFHQLNNGPIFGDDTEEILNEVFLSK